MAKYSTGGGGSGSSESCELCGAEDRDLQTATVAGARLSVCSECAQHGEDGAKSGSDGDRDRKRRAAQNTARVQDAARGDSEHWEDGADYDDDQLPYLVSDYGQRLTEARQAAGLQAAELAEEIGVDESEIIAVEQGRATKAGIGGSVIADLEAELDVALADST
jgi:ribosome-binding protein aMBF1 (putative translation factor)